MKAKKLVKKFSPISFLALLFLMLPRVACAQIRCNGDTGINSAVGCIPFGNSNELTIFLLRLGIGIGGGIAFVLMIYAGFLIITSAGNPQKLNSGKELLVAALSGLLLLLLSVFILRLFGQDILNLPGF